MQMNIDHFVKSDNVKFRNLTKGELKSGIITG